MKRKVITVAVVLWTVSIIGGGAWGRLEQYWRMRSIPPGQTEIQNLKALYDARLFDEVLAECDRADVDARYADYQPQMLYIRWVTDRTLRRTDDANEAQRMFLSRFPDHLLAADMHFITAMDRLAAADEQGGEAELATIQARFPAAHIASKAENMLAKLRKAASPGVEATQY